MSLKDARTNIGRKRKNITQEEYQLAIAQNEVIKLVLPELHKRLSHLEEMVETLVLQNSVGIEV